MKREVRAEKFAKEWRIQAKAKGEDRWTYYDVPLTEDLIELRDIVWRKYQRKRLPWDDVAYLDKLLAERGIQPPEDAVPDAPGSSRSPQEDDDNED